MRAIGSNAEKKSKDNLHAMNILKCGAAFAYNWGVVPNLFGDVS